MTRVKNKEFPILDILFWTFSYFSKTQRWKEEYNRYCQVFMENQSIVEVRKFLKKNQVPMKVSVLVKVLLFRESLYIFRKSYFVV